MSKILALDASTEVCSVAVGDGSQIVSRFCDTPKSHSKMLLPLVEQVLAEANMTLGELDAIAATRGPGSFTGIRIGLGIVQGLSYGASLPIVGLSTLETLAQTFIQGHPVTTNSLIVPCLDARMGEVYSAVYQQTESGWQEVVAPAVGSPDNLAKNLTEQFKTQTLVGIGHGWGIEPLSGIVLKQVDMELKPQASAALELAQCLFTLADDDDMSEHNQNFPVASIEPIYLRNEITWKKRQRIRQ